MSFMARDRINSWKTGFIHLSCVLDWLRVESKVVWEVVLEGVTGFPLGWDRGQNHSLLFLFQLHLSGSSWCIFEIPAPGCMSVLVFSVLWVFTTVRAAEILNSFALTAVGVASQMPLSV